MNLLVDIADTSSTIAAISTPAGVGGIAVARLSGPDALAVADRIWHGKKLSEVPSHTARLGTVTDTNGEPLDQAVAVVYRGPHSFTGQDTVEFSIHGSQYIQREIIASLVRAGARVALPGEFTRRAFASGKLDLSRAEAVADMIASDSRASHRLAMSQLSGRFAGNIDSLRRKLIDLVSLLELELDFSEEDVEFADRTQLRENALEIERRIERLLNTFHTGSAIKNGIPVAIVGPTNAGKSSLLNALVDDDRAIVSDIHGTTRDTVEETVEIGDYLFRFIDTAGIRHTDDPVEKMGIERSLKALDKAFIVIALIDVTNPEAGMENLRKITQNLRPHQTLLAVANKTDLDDSDTYGCLPVSAKTGAGLETLKQRMTHAITRLQTENTDANATAETENIMVTNQRHAEALRRALDATRALVDGMDSGLPTELLAHDAHTIIDSLAEITGQITTTDILTTIFSRFCIGK